MTAATASQHCGFRDKTRVVAVQCGEATATAGRRNVVEAQTVVRYARL